jgi:hypothetical protein
VFGVQDPYPPVSVKNVKVESTVELHEVHLRESALVVHPAQLEWQY